VSALGFLDVSGIHSQWSKKLSLLSRGKQRRDAPFQWLRRLAALALRSASATCNIYIDHDFSKHIRVYYMKNPIFIPMMQYIIRVHFTPLNFAFYFLGTDHCLPLLHPSIKKKKKLYISFLKDSLFFSKFD
jgi:hypothetical protein